LSRNQSRGMGYLVGGGGWARAAAGGGGGGAPGAAAAGPPRRAAPRARAAHTRAPPPPTRAPPPPPRPAADRADAHPEPRRRAPDTNQIPRSFNTVPARDVTPVEAVPERNRIKRIAGTHRVFTRWCAGAWIYRRLRPVRWTRRTRGHEEREREHARERARVQA